ncbi:uncharacterized protein HaLaN_01612, partial [Haematococcus lacustris]
MCTNTTLSTSSAAVTITLTLTFTAGTIASTCINATGPSPPPMLQVTDQGVQVLAGGCCALQLLSVRRVPKVGDAGIVALAAHGSLRHLALHGNAGVTDASLAALATHCAHTLSSLDISFC